MYLNVNFSEYLNEFGGYFEGSVSRDGLSSVKGYDALDHAYELIEQDNTLSLIDAITNLRRAVNLRVADISSNIGLDNIKFQLGKNKKLERLEELGLVKPLLINKLLLLRNEIEYQGVDPPTKLICSELADVVWYFYKSTDRYCNITPDDLLVEWEENGCECWFTLEFDLSLHEKIKIRGELPLEYISIDKISSNSIELPDEIVNDSNKIRSKGSQFYFDVEIDTKQISYYKELFACALAVWGN